MFGAHAATNSAHNDAQSVRTFRAGTFKSRVEIAEFSGNHKATCLKPDGPYLGSENGNNPPLITARGHSPRFR
jgi:hypothetical protein